VFFAFLAFLTASLFALVLQHRYVVELILFVALSFLFHIAIFIAVALNVQFLKHLINGEFYF